MLTPLGARLLLGFRLDEVGNRLIDPVDLFDAAARETIERLQGANSHAGRLMLLEQGIARRLGLSVSALSQDLLWALQRLQASAGRVGVASLAGELGWSRKHFTMCFRRESVVPPKLFARILRFDHAIRLMRRDQVPSWRMPAATPIRRI